MPRHKGTKDVSPGKNPNICTGCSHDCIYCYAKDMALKRGSEKGGIDHVDEWKNMKIRRKDVDHRYRKKWAYAPLFPSSHDITPEILGDYLTALGNFLEPGSKVNITSKPHLECIKAICERYGDYTDKIQFMFTFTAKDDKILSFWEPNAPGYEERKACLKYVYDAGFNTRVFIEPMWDPDNLEDLVNDISPFITIDIWVGKMNHFNRIKKMYPDSVEIDNALDTLEAKYTDERIVGLFNHFKDNPLVKWKTGTLPEQGENMPKKKTKKDRVKKITKYDLHPIASVYPEIQGQHYENLKKSIKANGLRQPITLYEGKIIDGKNRYRACKELGIEPSVIEWDGKGSLADFVKDLNAHRRDLTKTQRAIAGVELEQFYAKEAKERMLAGKKMKPSRKNAPGSKGKASVLAAKDCGVSSRYVEKAKEIKEKDRDTYKQMKAGLLTIGQAVVSMNKKKKIEFPVEGLIGYVRIQADLPKGIFVHKVSLDKFTNNILIMLRHDNIMGIDKNVWKDLPKTPPFIVGKLQLMTIIDEEMEGQITHDEAVEKFQVEQALKKSKSNILKTQDKSKKGKVKTAKIKDKKIRKVFEKMAA